MRKGNRNKEDVPVLQMGKAWADLSFPEALLQAREKLSALRGSWVTQREIAQVCGIPSTTYHAMEAGGRRLAPPHMCEIIAGKYNFVWEIAEGLRECHAARWKEVSYPSQNLLSESLEEDMIGEAAAKARTMLRSEGFAAAYAFTAQRWPHVQRALASTCTVDFGLIHAQAASEAGDHRIARHTIVEVRRQHGPSASGLQRGYLSLYGAIFSIREQRATGLQAAAAFRDTVDELKGLAGECPEKNKEYRYLWNHTLRSIVINLANGFGTPEAEYYAVIKEAFEASSKDLNIASYHVANGLVRDRIAALESESKEIASQLFSRIQLSELGVSDRLFASHSLIIALDRQGDFRGAAQVAQDSVELCHARRYSRKAAQFQRLLDSILVKSGKVNLPKL